MRQLAVGQPCEAVPHYDDRASLRRCQEVQDEIKIKIRISTIGLLSQMGLIVRRQQHRSGEGGGANFMSMR